MLDRTIEPTTTIPARCIPVLDYITAHPGCTRAEFAEQVTSIAAACVGKHRFDTPQAAYKAIHRTTAATVRPYRCEHCGGFHLGNRKRRRKIFRR